MDKLLNLEEQLKAEQSRRNSNYIAYFIGKDTTRIKKLVEAIYHDDPKVYSRAAWVLEILWEQYPELIEPYLDGFVKHVLIVQHHGLKRHLLKIIAGSEIDEKHWGILADFCFNILSSPDEKVAAKVHAMQIIFMFCKKIPELGNELKIVLEEEMHKNSKAFASRGQKILKSLKNYTVVR